MTHRVLWFKNEQTNRKDEGGALEMEADRLGPENPSWRFTQKGGGARALRRWSPGCKRVTRSAWTGCTRQTWLPGNVGDPVFETRG